MKSISWSNFEGEQISKAWCTRVPIRLFFLLLGPNNGVAMGSPLGPALANIFVGYQEEKLFIDNNQPLIYFRYVDDTFAMFENELNCNRFLKQLNSLHQSLNFTHEKEVNGKLPFLDVLVEKSNTKFLTSVYRKPSFSGQYNHWDSFGPKSRKNNPIGTLVYRALEICSPSKLLQEIDFIRSILYSSLLPIRTFRHSHQLRSL